MIKVLVVDDEKWIREGIISKVHGYRHDILCVYGAADGEEALQIVEENCPDVIITDIRMTNMDGLQLMRTVHKKHPGIKFIVVSGYADFEYAQQAIDMGVSAYLLKPIKDGEFANALTKAIDDFNAESRIVNIINEVEELRNDNNFLVTEKLLNKILHSVNYNKQDFEKLKSYKKIDEKHHILGLIQVDPSNYKTSDFETDDIVVIKYAITNVLLEISKNFSITEDNICVFYNFKEVNQIFVWGSDAEDADLKNKFLGLMNDVRDKIYKYLKISVTIAVSEEETSFSNLLYKQAKEAFNLRFVHGSNSVYTYEYKSKSLPAEDYASKLRMLEKCLKIYDYHNIELVLSNIFSANNLQKINAANIKYLYFLTVNTIIKTFSSMNIEIPPDTDILSDDILDSFYEPSQITEYILEAIRGICVEPKDLPSDCKNIIKEAIEYINKNYFEELSVKGLSNKFGINPNYFSTLFKNETDKPFTKYLAELRINKACEILKNTDVNIIEVANSVGYTDSQYFYRVFKQVTGRTPLEYRLEYR